VSIAITSVVECPPHRKLVFMSDLGGPESMISPDTIVVAVTGDRAEDARRIADAICAAGWTLPAVPAAPTAR
jgi:hypothetical protein